MSNVNIPQKAGFVPTPKEWDDLVRIAENLGAQVVQRDAALRQAQAERDAARAEVARMRKALEFYANRNHWMAIREDADDQVLIAHGPHFNGTSDGWVEADAALRGQPAQAKAQE